MVLYLGEPIGRCLLLLFIHFSFFILLSFLFFILLLLFFISFPGYFPMSLTPHPSFSGPWRPPVALSSTQATFDCLCFFIYCKRYGFEWGFFFPQAFITLRSFTDIFDSTYVYQGLPGNRQFFLEVCRASHWHPQNTDLAHLFVWFAVIHNLHIQKNSHLNSTKYYHGLLVVKSLVYMLLTRFKLF